MGEKNKEKLINREQTSEQIREVLVKAVCEKLHVDLVILSSKGEPESVQDLIVEELKGDVALMSYIKDDGEFGELIPLELSRVKGVKIRK
jgi:hypothetical protein